MACVVRKHCFPCLRVKSRSEEIDGGGHMKTDDSCVNKTKINKALNSKTKQIMKKNIKT